MIEFLESRNAIPKDGGFRPQEIMTPFLRQLIYQKAIISTWDIPGSPHYKKPYALSQIKDIQPYCYVDLQSIIFVWTLLGSQYIDGNNCSVIKGACTFAGVEWNDGMSAYDVFTHKGEREIQFRRRMNPNYRQGRSPEKDKYLVDLNYITIRGNTFNSICEKIATNTPKTNKLFAVDVKGILLQLSEKMMEPPRGGIQTHALWNGRVFALLYWG